ncbi:MAG: GNAT family acetyltransferase [Verrucomicrobiota bacterium]
MNVVIEPFSNERHREAVVELWASVFAYESPHNQPELVIDKKLAMDDRLFFVAISDDLVVGSIMAGYDGHRGWLYSVAVMPEFRDRGIGTALVKEAEQALARLGCLKINQQIVEGNEGVAKFYEALGYAPEVRVSMGKRLPQSG